MDWNMYSRRLAAWEVRPRAISSRASLGSASSRVNTGPAFVGTSPSVSQSCAIDRIAGEVIDQLGDLVGSPITDGFDEFKQRPPDL